MSEDTFHSEAGQDETRHWKSHSGLVSRFRNFACKVGNVHRLLRHFFVRSCVFWWRWSRDDFQKEEDIGLAWWPQPPERKVMEFASGFFFYLWFLSPDVGLWSRWALLFAPLGGNCGIPFGSSEVEWWRKGHRKCYEAWMMANYGCEECWCSSF